MRQNKVVSDEALEKRIVRLMALPVEYDYPKPTLAQNKYGFDEYECPVCQQRCSVHGGYEKHYTAKHAPGNDRQIAKRIIKAVREATQ